MKKQNVNYNVRIIRTPGGKYRLGFVQFLSGPHIEKYGPFKGSKYTQWRNAPAAIRREIAQRLDAKLV